MILQSPLRFKMVFFPILLAKRGRNWQQDLGQSPGNALQTAPPPGLPKPGFRKKGRPTLGIHIDLENIGMGGDGWWCLQPAPEPEASFGRHAGVPVTCERKTQAGPFT